MPMRLDPNLNSPIAMQKRKSSQPESSSKKKWIAVVIVLLLLVNATAAWAMRSGEDPQVARVREMWTQMEQVPDNVRASSGANSSARFARRWRS